MNLPTPPGRSAHPLTMPDHPTILVVLALLILTAWGSATALFAVSLIGLVVVLVLHPRSMSYRVLVVGALVAALAGVGVLMWTR